MTIKQAVIKFILGAGGITVVAWLLYAVFGV